MGREWFHPEQRVWMGYYSELNMSVSCGVFLCCLWIFHLLKYILIYLVPTVHWPPWRETKEDEIWPLCEELTDGVKVKLFWRSYIIIRESGSSQDVTGHRGVITKWKALIRVRLSEEGEIKWAAGIRRDFMEEVGGVPNPWHLLPDRRLGMWVWLAPLLRMVNKDGKSESEPRPICT